MGRALAELGLADSYLREDAERLSTAMADLWQAAIGPVDDFEADLRRLKSLFDPVATGARLRRELLALPPAPPSACSLPAELALVIDDERVIPTPETRAAMEVLSASDVGGGVVLFEEDAVFDAHAALVRLYREWGRHRLMSVIALMHGDERPLQVPAIGVAVALLVNRNTAPERALTRFSDRDDRRMVDETFFPPADAFAERVSPSTRRSQEKEQLIGGWRLHEVVRRAPEALVIEPDRVYIAPGAEAGLIDVLATALARRESLTAEALNSGLQALVAELRARLPRLETLGLTFERPHETARVVERLIGAFAAHRAEDEPSGAP